MDKYELTDRINALIAERGVRFVGFRAPSKKGGEYLLTTFLGKSKAHVVRETPRGPGLWLVSRERCSTVECGSTMRELEPVKIVARAERMDREVEVYRRYRRALADRVERLRFDAIRALCDSDFDKAEDLCSDALLLQRKIERIDARLEGVK